MPIKERKSVELFENGLPKEFLNSQVRYRLKITTIRVALERKVVYVFFVLCFQCFEISYNRQKCNLTIQHEYTEEGDKYCFENNFGSKPKVFLDCKAKKMGSEKVSITSLKEIGKMS